MTTESKTAFTPGPWKATKEASETTDFEPRCSITAADASMQTGRRLVAELWVDTFWGRMAEDEANANLITAAPELYEALAVLRDCARYQADFHGAPEFEQARAALAKARGE